MKQKHDCACEPMGSTDIAALLGVKPNTVSQWQLRPGAAFPPARWVASGNPLWCKTEDILPWATATGRL